MKQSKEFENYCMKSNSNVDFPCPKHILEKVTDETLPYSTKANLVKMNNKFSKFVIDSPPTHLTRIDWQTYVNVIWP